MIKYLFLLFLPLTLNAQSISASVNWLVEPKVGLRDIGKVNISGNDFSHIETPAGGITGYFNIICEPALQIEFLTEPNKIHSISASNDLVVWTTFDFRIVGNGNKFVFLDSLEKAYIFYKVNTSL